MTGLHLAAYFGVEKLVYNFLESGFAVNLKDSYGRTPLSWTEQNGHMAVVQQLLGRDAEVDAKDGYGQTPLSLAAWNVHEVVEQARSFSSRGP
jgi:ankyrin repeat protein